MKIRTEKDRSTGAKPKTEKRDTFRAIVAQEGPFAVYFAAHHEQIEGKDGKKEWTPTGQLSLKLDVAAQGSRPVTVAGMNHAGKGPLAALMADVAALAKVLQDAQTAWDDDDVYSEARTALDAFLAERKTEQEQVTPEAPATEAPTVATAAPQAAAPAAPKDRSASTAAPKTSGGLAGLVPKK